MATGVMTRLHGLYRRPLYVRLFTLLRTRLAAYAQVESYVPPSGLILDVGCGYGIFSNYLALRSVTRTVHGIDLNQRKLGHADKGLPNACFSLRNILFATDADQYDAIVFLHVLHHLSSFDAQRAMLARCHDLLGPDGCVVVLEVDRRPRRKFALAWLADHVLYPGDRIFYRDQQSFLALFRESGFRPEVIPLHRRRLFPQMLYVCRKV